MCWQYLDVTGPLEGNSDGWGTHVSISGFTERDFISQACFGLSCDICFSVIMQQEGPQEMMALCSWILLHLEHAWFHFFFFS